MANIFAEISAVSDIKKTMEQYAEEIYNTNQTIDAILDTLNSESSGQFAEDLKTAACSLIDFGFDLFKVLMSCLNAVGDVAERLSRTDQDGANMLGSSAVYGRR